MTDEKRIMIRATLRALGPLPNMSKYEKQRSRKILLKMLFKQEKKQITNKQVGESRHKFKICYPLPGEAALGSDEKSGNCPVDRRAEKPAVAIHRNTVLLGEALGLSFTGREIKDSGFFPRGVDRLVYEYVGEEYFGNTKLVNYESKETRIYFVSCFTQVKITHGAYPGRILSGLKIGICGKEFDIPYYKPDVRQLGVLSERNPEPALIDWQHFMIIFDHRVDFYHLPFPLEKGDNGVTRIYTLRPTETLTPMTYLGDEIRGDELSRKGERRYRFFARAGGIDVANAFQGSRTNLLRLAVFPLNCPLCKQH